MTPQEKWDAEAGAYDGIEPRPSEKDERDSDFNACCFKSLCLKNAEELRALQSATERSGVLVPQDVWEWLMGEGPDFEPTEAQKATLMGPGRYWWRSELRRRLDRTGDLPAPSTRSKA